MPVLLLDNRDSFTWNLVQLLWGLGVEVEVLERSTATLSACRALDPSHVVVGPGPGHPADAPLSRALFDAFADRPVLGVCLGHQALALAAGGRIVAAPELAHGRAVEVHHDATGLFAGLPVPWRAGRYHSLSVDPAAVPATLRVSASSSAGEVLGLAHRDRPHHGVQFHPESILADHGGRLLANFLALGALGGVTPR